MRLPWLALLPAIAFSLLAPAGASRAADPVPRKDLQGARDHPLLKRYEGSLILDYEEKSHDVLRVPLGRLERSRERDAEGNKALIAQQERSAEGAYTRILYLIPEGRSALEVLRNYQQEITESAGTSLYECSDAACGGRLQGTSPRRIADSLFAFLYPAEKITARIGSNTWCAVSLKLTSQRYGLLERMQDGSGTLFSILAYELSGGVSSCAQLTGRTFAMVQILERKAREQKMVKVSAQEMRASLDASGRVALYGIYFDHDQAAVKPDSQPALDEIAKLLREDPKLSVLIVGHTDNQGAFDYNLGLSERRARAVVDVLQDRYGIASTRLRPAGVGMLAPSESNETEEGRARNRRVELVKP
jgi:OmpA-OmpF porin, OOP family